MVLQHNMAALNTNRQIGKTNRELAKNAERLNSGYRVNRAADDAAGLAISEKMRAQIRGLNQGVRNGADAISLIQTAEGALNETHVILHRMRDLSVQAANDTNTIDDRAAIQMEIDQLTEEIDRIANQTEFNSGIYPLRGGKKIVTLNNSGSITNSEKYVLPPYLKEIHRNGCIGVWISSDDFGGNTSILGNYKELVFGLDVSLLTNDLSNSSLNSATWDDLSLNDLEIDENGYVYYLGLGGRYKVYLQLNFNGQNNNVGSDVFTPNQNCVKAIKGTSDTNDEEEEQSQEAYQGDLWIQLAANSEQGMFLSTVDATAAGIGLSSLSVLSHEAATNSITSIDGALQKVSGYRSYFGAQQNRIEHANAADDNTAENLQYAESKLRDTDMADEMVGFSKNNILLQAGHSMLAQANEITNGVLRLLQ